MTQPMDVVVGGAVGRDGERKKAFLVFPGMRDPEHLLGQFMLRRVRLYLAPFGAVHE